MKILLEFNDAVKIISLPQEDADRILKTGYYEERVAYRIKFDPNIKWSEQMIAEMTPYITIQYEIIYTSAEVIFMRGYLGR